jgi:hypothetical protein
MPGKPWTLEEELRLKKLAGQRLGLNVIAGHLGKSEGAVFEKAKRLGVVVKGSQSTTRELILPPELPSVEEALKILAGALQRSAEVGLDKVEVQRLQVVATLARTYKEILADYVDYRRIETELVDLEAKYARFTERRDLKERATLGSVKDGSDEMASEYGQE